MQKQMGVREREKEHCNEPLSGWVSTPDLCAVIPWGLLMDLHHVETHLVAQTKSRALPQGDCPKVGGDEGMFLANGDMKRGKSPEVRQGEKQMQHTRSLLTE